ncbi:1,4-dihydroxy-2-naphthoate octaprenyltransferase, partial [Bifidobacterium breve]
MSIGLWLKGARPKTLATSIASVMVGAAMARVHIEQMGTCVAIYPEPAYCAANRAQQDLLLGRFWTVTFLCLLVALFLQIAVNYANDYSDGVRGTDAGRGGSESQSGKPQRLTESGLV